MSSDPLAIAISTSIAVVPAPSWIHRSVFSSPLLIFTDPFQGNCLPQSSGQDGNRAYGDAGVSGAVGVTVGACKSSSRMVLLNIILGDE